MGDAGSDFERLYGSWRPRTPADVTELLHEYPGTWWIAGGWALEAFTGVQRHHEDIDPAVLRDQLPLLRHHLTDRLDIWAAFSGALRPVHPDDGVFWPASDDPLSRLTGVYPIPSSDHRLVWADVDVPGGGKKH